MLRPQLRPELYGLHTICFPQPLFKVGGAAAVIQSLKKVTSLQRGPEASLWDLSLLFSPQQTACSLGLPVSA